MTNSPAPRFRNTVCKNDILEWHSHYAPTGREIAEAFLLHIRICFLTIGFLAATTPIRAAETAPSAMDGLSLHGQMTFVEQYHPAFHATYTGQNSLDPGNRGNETFDATVFAGARVWQGGELYANLEMDQGFGLSNTLGMAGYTSGEAYKVGKDTPYLRLQRLFFRQSFDLGGETQPVADDANQIAGTQTTDNLVITAGKLSVTDIFDTNSYAHDPKADFLNWALIDSGAFDYAADAWGYSYGLAAELTKGRWTIRGGFFDLSRVPNTTELQRGFGQFELVGEAEERHTLWGAAGKLKLLGFVNRGRMGDYGAALTAAHTAATLPDTAGVRLYTSRPGIAVNAEQAITEDLGTFARLSWNDGSKEAYEFTEINRSAAVGLSLKGTAWQRAEDTIGVAIATNGLSDAARRYFAQGGMGILIGDGKLPHYDSETISEVYYAASLTQSLSASADYQLVVNPAYNRDRGPVSIFGFRLHAHI